MAPDGDGSGLSGVVTSETDPIVGAITGVVVADGAGNISAASNLTDTAIPDVVYEADCSDNTTAKQICIEADGETYVGTGTAATCITCVSSLDDNDVVSLIGTAGTNTPTLYALTPT